MRPRTSRLVTQCRKHRRRPSRRRRQPLPRGARPPPRPRRPSRPRPTPCPIRRPADRRSSRHASSSSGRRPRRSRSRSPRPHQRQRLGQAPRRPSRRPARRPRPRRLRRPLSRCESRRASRRCARSRASAPPEQTRTLHPRLRRGPSSQPGRSGVRPLLRPRRPLPSPRSTPLPSPPSRVWRRSHPRRPLPRRVWKSARRRWRSGSGGSRCALRRRRRLLPSPRLHPPRDLHRPAASATSPSRAATSTAPSIEA